MCFLGDPAGQSITKWPFILSLNRVCVWLFELLQNHSLSLLWLICVTQLCIEPYLTRIVCTVYLMNLGGKKSFKKQWRTFKYNKIVFFSGKCCISFLDAIYFEYVWFWFSFMCYSDTILIGEIIALTVICTLIILCVFFNIDHKTSRCCQGNN